MNTEKKIFICLMAIFLIGLFGQTTLSAAPPAANPVVTPVKPPKPSVDLLVHFVEYFNCPCTMPASFDMEYISDMISVKVGNGSLAHEVRATVFLEFFDMRQNRMVRHSKAIQLGKNQHTKIMMINQPVLIKKSVGVKASIMLTSPEYRDTNPGNNHIVQKTCGQIPE